MDGALQVVDVVERSHYRPSPGVVYLVFGRTPEGQSACVRVHGFLPYMYVRSEDPSPGDAAIEEIRRGLVRLVRASDHAQLSARIRHGYVTDKARFIISKEDEAVAEFAAGGVGGVGGEDPDDFVDRIVSVERADGHFPLMGYQDAPLEGILKVSVTLPRYVRMLRDACATGQAAHLGLCTDVYETETKAMLQCMIDYDFGGGEYVGWVLRSATQAWEPIAAKDPAFEVSWALRAHTVDVHCTELVGKSDPRCTALAPVSEVILSFDGEMTQTPGHLPDGSVDDNLVIQLACSVVSSGTTADNASPIGNGGATAPGCVRNVVFCLGETGAIPNGEVRWFDTEAELLLAFRDFVLEVDPDVITGWNIEGFDFFFLVNRVYHLEVHSQRLGLPAASEDLLRWSRLESHVVKNYERVYETNQTGRAESNSTTIPGRVVLDGLTLFKRKTQLRSYKLDDVALKFLDARKDDVHWTEITPMWRSGDPLKRARLAQYCVQDAWLVNRLLLKKQYWMETRALSSVAGVPPQMTISNGQSVRVEVTTMRQCRREPERYIARYIPRDGDAAHDQPALPLSEARALANAQGESVPRDPMRNRTEPESRSRTVGFEGATVVEPKKGFYTMPVFTLDFEGLYPSIMRAHNLDFSTMLSKKIGEQWTISRPADVTHTPNGEYFVKPHVRVGVLPKVLETMYHARKAAKRAMFDAAKAGDDATRAVFDGRQLALKLSSNSIYGFTGASMGKWFCPAISASVTAFGREGIDISIAGALEFDSRLITIYGDTDSIMVKVDLDHFIPHHRSMNKSEIMHDVICLATRVNDFINTKFTRPINLEFEKVFWPYLLISKKRYAGMHYESDDMSKGFLDVKGMEAKRRDNAILTAQVVGTVLDTLLLKSDSDAAIRYVVGVVGDLLHGRVSYDQLVISKAFARADYVAKQPHVELISKMKTRGVDDYHVSMGDRVPYVICAAETEGLSAKWDGKSLINKMSLASARAEDPEYAQKHNMPIDALYYIDNQLRKPLCRIFGPVIAADEPNKPAMQRRVTQVLFGEMKTYVCPRRGIVHRLYSTELKDALWGHASSNLSGKGKKGARPTPQPLMFHTPAQTTLTSFFLPPNAGAGAGAGH